MSDPVVEPGADGPKDVAPPSKGAISKDYSVQKNAISLAAQADSVVLRLNKLIGSPGGLSSLLSTSNYALYLIAHLRTQTPFLARFSQLFLHTLNYKRPIPPTKPPPTPSTVAAISPLLSLASLISKTRTNLRLLGLPAIYATLRALLTKTSGPTDDALLHRITITQCLGYFAFQLLENIYVLIEAGVIPKSFLDRFARGGKADVGRVMLWSCRAWLVGVSCDLLRVLREAVLMRRRREVAGSGDEQGDARTNVEKGGKREMDDEDAKWWRELIVPVSWLPVAVHYSLEGGVPGMNMGIMGLCGMIAGIGKTQALWAATKA
ncbi:hypothetical protein EV356DRAFT_576770 [Viridothelium virens]|uniref:Peroxin 11C n=1 Tax=Viridothelium virens TaxID=1048519 RepID=A0A6A6H8Q2_VIRVR|nr:hypothetical protein EV356DRAFT_576770 [Viridothelium virens]